MRVPLGEELQVQAGVVGQGEGAVGLQERTVSRGCHDRAGDGQEVLVGRHEGDEGGHGERQHHAFGVQDYPNQVEVAFEADLANAL